MPEQLTESTPGQLRCAQWARRMTWSLACVLPLGSIPAAVFAQTVPSALRLCAAQTDAGQRLDCYDREMARLLAPQKQPAAGASKPGFPGSGTPAQVSSPTPAQVPSPASASSSGPAEVPPATVAKSADTAPASGGTSAPQRTSTWKKLLGGGASSQVTAHIARLDRWPDAMVLHLDNGQVWQQIGRASGDLSLQAGDSVKIEKHLGSYWLSSRHVSDMQVRLKSQ